MTFYFVYKFKTNLMFLFPDIDIKQDDENVSLNKPVLYGINESPKNIIIHLLLSSAELTLLV